MDEDELRGLIEETIDVMIELGEARQKLASATRRIEDISRALDARWRPELYASTTLEERQ